MRRISTMGAGLAALLAVAGCTRSMPSLGDGGGGPAPLTPAPASPVYSNQLPPPPTPPAPPAPGGVMTGDNTTMNGTTPGAGAPGTAQPGGQTQVASTGPAVSKESMVGAWKVSSGGGNCQIFMALTKWTGGYRAASRGCPGQVADVSAWDVSGSQVVLKDSSGSTVAQLSGSGGTRYEGQTSGGQAISLYR
ncbi:protease inhibitor Inh/omp19 family protein [Consotaella salsifontis]|uniref:Protease inhibitor Inh n=1 Tax=Consotaella salsifontis TaxID=1365950 RepID=A0A1T4T5M1_9HYPH|nr:protease inhibitor Inh/omp19 family protein [Consotaella salsifontis]SKA35561.1 Protease inhibitor Inh [Consotaella salsifontis]